MRTTWKFALVSSLIMPSVNKALGPTLQEDVDGTWNLTGNANANLTRNINATAEKKDICDLDFPYQGTEIDDFEKCEKDKICSAKMKAWEDEYKHKCNPTKEQQATTKKKDICDSDFPYQGTEIDDFQKCEKDKICSAKMKAWEDKYKHNCPRQKKQQATTKFKDICDSDFPYQGTEIDDFQKCEKDKICSAKMKAWEDEYKHNCNPTQEQQATTKKKDICDSDFPYQGTEIDDFEKCEKDKICSAKMKAWEDEYKHNCPRQKKKKTYNEFTEAICGSDFPEDEFGEDDWGEPEWDNCKRDTICNGKLEAWEEAYENLCEDSDGYNTNNHTKSHNTHDKSHQGEVFEASLFLTVKNPEGFCDDPRISAGVKEYFEGLFGYTSSSLLLELSVARQALHHVKKSLLTKSNHPLVKATVKVTGVAKEKQSEMTKKIITAENAGDLAKGINKAVAKKGGSADVSGTCACAEQ